MCLTLHRYDRDGTLPSPTRIGKDDCCVISLVPDGSTCNTDDDTILIQATRPISTSAD